MTEPTQSKPIRLGGIILGFVAVVCLFMAGQVIDRARENVRRGSCIYKLKQLGGAFAMYADMYHGRCPMDSTNPTLVGSAQLLSNVLDSAEILHCPDDHRPGARAETDFKKLTSKNISYSYVPNQILSTNDESTVIIALDRIYSTSVGSKWPTNGNHEGQGGNVLFRDRHLEFRTSLPSALKDKDGKEIVLSP